MIELLSTNDPVLRSFVTALLADAGIQHVVADAHMSVIEGSIAALPGRILVPSERRDEARRLLADAGVPLESTTR